MRRYAPVEKVAGQTCSSRTVGELLPATEEDTREKSARSSRIAERREGGCFFIRYIRGETLAIASWGKADFSSVNAKVAKHSALAHKETISLAFIFPLLPPESPSFSPFPAFSLDFLPVRFRRVPHFACSDAL